MDGGRMTFTKAQLRKWTKQSLIDLIVDELCFTNDEEEEE
jgi:hypothetical protein